LDFGSSKGVAFLFLSIFGSPRVTRHFPGYGESSKIEIRQSKVEPLEPLSQRVY
jgi:hypothetical protein